MIEYLQYGIMYLGITYAVCVFLLGAYIVVMTFEGARARDGLSIRDKVFGYPWYPIGFLVDVIANILLTGVFFDLPREFYVTNRLRRYRTDDDYVGWRRERATKICKWISKYDPDGAHC